MFETFICYVNEGINIELTSHTPCGGDIDLPSLLKASQTHTHTHTTHTHSTVHRSIMLHIPVIDKLAEVCRGGAAESFHICLSLLHSVCVCVCACVCNGMTALLVLWESLPLLKAWLPWQPNEMLIEWRHVCLAPPPSYLPLMSVSFSLSLPLLSHLPPSIPLYPFSFFLALCLSLSFIYSLSFSLHPSLLSCLGCYAVDEPGPGLMLRRRGEE